MSKEKNKWTDYPAWVCTDCATATGATLRTSAPTFHFDTCGVCLEQKAVTEPRDFGYPKFKVKVKGEH